MEFKRTFVFCPDLRMDGGLPPGFQKGFLITETCCNATFMMNFGGKQPIFGYFSPISV